MNINHYHIKIPIIPIDNGQVLKDERVNIYNYKYINIIYIFNIFINR